VQIASPEFDRRCELIPRCAKFPPVIRRDAPIFRQSVSLFAGTAIAKRNYNVNPQAEIEVIVNRLRPFLQADGGDIELASVTGRKAFVRLSGKCAGCPSSHLTLHIGVEMAIRDALPDFEEVVLL
jgi:Fe-S cluster biogenesis protein NfuA